MALIPVLRVVIDGLEEGLPVVKIEPLQFCRLLRAVPAGGVFIRTNGMVGDAVNGDNNTATDNNDGTVSGALGNGVRDLGEGVGDAVEDVGDAVGNAAEGR